MYAELRRVHQEIVKERRVKLTRGVLLLQGNAPAYTSQVTMAVATKCSLQVLSHPPYSPDLAPSDFYLFPYLITYLRYRQFWSKKDAVDEYLWDREEGFYSEGISKLEQRWRKCIEAKGDYTEK